MDEEKEAGKGMTDHRRERAGSKEQLVSAAKHLGFAGDLGEQIAMQLGSPKAMDRMTACLNYVKLKSVELVVDEMLAICIEIEAWREKKASE